MEEQQEKEVSIEDLYKESELAMKELVENHEKKKVEDQEKLIESFKNNLKMKKKPVNRNRKDFKKIFENAKQYAFDMLYECTIMNIEDIAHVFSTENVILDPTQDTGYPEYTNYYWYHNFRKDNNTIPLPYDMEKPKRRDNKTGKMVEMIFSISHFYSDDNFIKACNNYFNKYNLFFNITKDNSKPKFKNSWKLELTVGEGGYINFNPEENENELENESENEETNSLKFENSFEE